MQATPQIARELREDQIPASAPISRFFRLALGLYSGSLLFGIVYGLFLQATPTSQQAPGPSKNIFIHLFAFNEPLPCAIQLLGLLVLLRWLQRGAKARLQLLRYLAQLSRPLPLIALVTVVIGIFGTFCVFHRFAFSMDEYMADFQARIFAEGKLTAEVPEQWRPYLRWIKPIFTVYNPTDHTWSSPYLPLYSALRAIPMKIGAEWLLNPALAGLSVISIASVARRIWNKKPDPGLIAAALLASSPQFLITSMTAYSMPAHLLFNLAWLWLFTHRKRYGMVAAPWLGLLAVGLHQPHVHLLFALPFGIRFLRNRQWRWAAYYLLVYLLALAVWTYWWAIFRPSTVDDTAGLFSLPDLDIFKVQLMNLTLLFSWQAGVLGLLALLAVRHWRTLPQIAQDLALGCALTLGAYFLFHSDQGHGWGYRYFHATLGSLALVAVGGWKSLEKELGRSQALQFTIWSIALSLFLILPTRMIQTESIVRPFSLVDNVMKSARADMVLFPLFGGWYSQDLLRNDPFLKTKPVVIGVINPDRNRLLSLQEQGEVLVFPPRAMSECGLTTSYFESR